MPVSWFSLFLPDWFGPDHSLPMPWTVIFFLYQWVAWLQGIQRTCERSFLCVKRFLQNRYCWQQSIQFHSSAFERNTLCSIFSWTTFWWSGNWWWAPILQGSELQLSKIILIFPCLNISAHDGYISTSEASFSPERCQTCIARKVSYARMVPKAWDPSN